MLEYGSPLVIVCPNVLGTLFLGFVLITIN